MDPQDFLCQAWLSEQRMVVGTGTGSVLLLDGGELKAEINVDERLTCVAPFSRGFVLGGASGYVLSPSLSRPAPGLVYLVADTNVGSSSKPSPAWATVSC